MSIGKRLSLKRKELNLSQEQLAALINVSRQSISKWETNMVIPDTDNLIALSKELGVSFEWIITGRDKGYNKGNKREYLLISLGISFLFIAILLKLIKPDIINEVSSVINFSSFHLLLVASILLFLIGFILMYNKKK